MIHKNTINFLALLQHNNNKEWFNTNRKLYETAKNNFIDFTTDVLTQLAFQDTQLQHLNAKDCIFRINRDVRFSKDKSPYKNNFGAYFCTGGKKSHLAGYYLHIEPHNSFIAGGVWMPQKEALQKIRQEIDYNLQTFESILQNSTFKKNFNSLDATTTLTKIPKGYSANNPALPYLKLKSFTVSKSINSIIENKQASLKTAKLLALLQPFVNFLNEALDN